MATSSARWRQCVIAPSCAGDGGGVWNRPARPPRPHMAGVAYAATPCTRLRGQRASKYGRRMSGTRPNGNLFPGRLLPRESPTRPAAHRHTERRQPWHSHRDLPSTHSRSTFVSSEAVFSPTQHSDNNRSPRKSTLPQCFSVKHPRLYKCVCKCQRNHSARLFPNARPWKRSSTLWWFNCNYSDKSSTALFQSCLFKAFMTNCINVNYHFNGYL